MKRAIDEIIATGGRQLSEQTANQQLIVRHFEQHAILLSMILDQKATSDPPPVIEVAVASAGVASDFPTNIWNNSQLDSFADIRDRFAKLKGCRARCRCKCHQPLTTQTPAALADIIGLVQISYSGKIFGLLCDNASCSENSKFVAQIYYSFPKWLLLNVLHVSATWTRGSGPELLIRTIRVRPFSAQIFTVVKQNNMQEFRRLLSTGEASIHDVDPNHKSLIHVSFYHFLSL